MVMEHNDDDGVVNSEPPVAMDIVANGSNDNDNNKETTSVDDPEAPPTTEANGGDDLQASASMESAGAISGGTPPDNLKEGEVPAPEVNDYYLRASASMESPPAEENGDDLKASASMESAGAISGGTPPDNLKEGEGAINNDVPAPEVNYDDLQPVASGESAGATSAYSREDEEVIDIEEQATLSEEPTRSVEEPAIQVVADVPPKAENVVVDAVEQQQVIMTEQDTELDAAPSLETAQSIENSEGHGVVVSEEEEAAPEEMATEQESVLSRAEALSERADALSARAETLSMTASGEQSSHAETLSMTASGEQSAPTETLSMTASGEQSMGSENMETTASRDEEQTTETFTPAEEPMVEPELPPVSVEETTNEPEPETVEESPETELTTSMSADSASSAGRYISASNTMDTAPSVEAAGSIESQSDVTPPTGPEEPRIVDSESQPPPALTDEYSDVTPASSTAPSDDMEARIQARLDRSRSRRSGHMGASPGIDSLRKSGVGALPAVSETTGPNTDSVSASSSMTQAERDQALKARLRSSAAAAPGASYRPAPGAQPSQPVASPTSQQTQPPPMTQAERDEALKARLRSSTGPPAHGSSYQQPRPGAQPAPAPPQSTQSAPMTQEQKDQALKARLRRSTAAPVHGASHQRVTGAQPAPTTTPHLAQSAPISQEQKDQALKARLRSTAPAARGASYQPSQSQPVAAAAPMTQEQKDQALKARLRSSAPAAHGATSQPSSSQPAAAAAPMTQEQKDQALKARLRSSAPAAHGATSQPSSSQPAAAVPMTQEQKDQELKARLRSNARGPPPPAATSQVSDRVGRPTRRQQQRLTQAEQDAQAKANARTGYPATAGPSVVHSAHQHAPPVMEGSSSVIVGTDKGGLSELERRREERAAARAERRGNRDESTMSIVPTSAPLPQTSRQQPVFSNMNEDERQRRYDTKMAQMGQSHVDISDHGGVTPEAVEPVAPQSLSRPTTTVFSNMSEDERQQRFDAKMNQMGQSHADRREKVGGNENIDPAQEQPITSSSSYSLNVPKSESFSVAEQPPSVREGMTTTITTTADRGVAVAPDVEYGEYTQPMLPDDDLAVAIAIDDDEEEEEKFFAYAVEYDPDSKPPIYQNRRFRLYAIGGACVLVILVIVLVLGLQSEPVPPPIVVTDAPSSSPSGAPTTSEFNKFVSHIANVVSPRVRIAGTPHQRALYWIMDEDPLMLRPDDPRLIQRYMMAFLYFHTTNNGETEWRSCNPPKEGEDEFCTLMEFTRLANDTITYEPKPDKIRWLSGQDVCKWEGVICAGSSEVQGVTLFGQKLTGTLPTELAALPFIQQISLAYNELTGQIPDIYAGLNHLLAIEFHGNMLTGTIPDAFYEQDSTSLVLFNVGENLLSGTLDTRLGLMTDLKGLHIFENNFYGVFPTELEKLSYLSFTRINGNEFEGTLPTILGRLGQLNELWAHEAGFSGGIPSELGNLRRLKDLRLWGNDMTGTIPEQLYNLSKLFRLSVREMKTGLTGTLSTRIGLLTDLEILKVSTNKLTGPIPTEIGNLSKLRLAWLQLNLLTGSMPLDICDGVGPGKLEFLQTDCFPIENPPNPCRAGCCSACCNRETEICLLREDG